MTRRIANEALVLFDCPDLGAIFDRGAMRERRARGLSGRVAVDHHIAKVLPPRAGCVVDEESLHPTHGTVRVIDCDYGPYAEGADLWVIDDLLLQPGEADVPHRAPSRLPSWAEVRRRLRAALGARYLWGGTSARGTPAQAAWLLARGLVTSEALAEDGDLAIAAEARGFDCSGLFCAATGFHFMGDCKDFSRVMPEALIPIPVSARRDPRALAALIQPGDVLLYRGHMIIAADDGACIQAVGEGENAEAFAEVAGVDPLTRYDGVVEDPLALILEGLLEVQRRSFSSDWAAYGEGSVFVLRPAYGS